MTHEPGTPPASLDGYYESDRAVAEYLLFHYGAPEHLLPWPQGPAGALGFPVRCADLAFLDPSGPIQRALDLGCAVGGATFALARRCPEVVGVDLSKRFIQAAQRLATEGSLRYPVRIEGDLEETAEALRPGFPEAHRVRFEVGDAMIPNPALGIFDVVLAANLLDRVPDPAALLAQMPHRLRRGGTLVLTSPYTWLEDYTPKDRWLSSPRQPTREVLASLLPDFRLVHRTDLPFLIREHRRKYQWSVAEATVWQRTV